MLLGHMKQVWSIVLIRIDLVVIITICVVRFIVHHHEFLDAEFDLTILSFIIIRYLTRIKALNLRGAFHRCFIGCKLFSLFSLDSFSFCCSFLNLAHVCLFLLAFLALSIILSFTLRKLSCLNRITLGSLSSFFSLKFSSFSCLGVCFMSLAFELNRLFLLSKSHLFHLQLLLLQGNPLVFELLLFFTLFLLLLLALFFVLWIFFCFCKLFLDVFGCFTSLVSLKSGVDLLFCQLVGSFLNQCLGGSCNFWLSHGFEVVDILGRSLLCIASIIVLLNLLREGLRIVTLWSVRLWSASHRTLAVALRHRLGLGLAHLWWLFLGRHTLLPSLSAQLDLHSGLFKLLHLLLGILYNIFDMILWHHLLARLLAGHPSLGFENLLLQLV